MGKNSQSESKSAKSTHNTFPLYRIYRFASKFDLFLTFLSWICAFLRGASMQIMFLLLGQATSAFENNTSGLTNRLVNTFILFLIIGGITFLLNIGSLVLNKHITNTIGQNLRLKYLEALITKEQAWQETNKINELAVRAGANTNIILRCIQQFIPLSILSLGSILTGLGICFYQGWQLALVCLSFVPIACYAYKLGLAYYYKESTMKDDAYPIAGSLVNQALSSIKTVIGLNGEDFEVKNYSKKLDEVITVIKNTAMKIGLVFGLTYGFNNVVTGVAFFVGSRFIYNNVFTYGDSHYRSGDVVSIYFNSVVIASSLGKLFTYIQQFTPTKIAASKIYAIIEKESLINPLGKTGLSLEKFNPEITLKNVEFSYPAKPEIKVLKNLNIVFEAGKRTAIVGPTGSGKSSIIQLIERFYDPEQGSISLDNHDLKNLNVSWLRKQLSYVGQEPVLMTGTVRENLIFGNETASEEKIIESLKQAEAYEFVMGLDKKLDTFLGNGGTQLSGGQKQRLAIARAILRDSPILLLDESTSALDRINEKKIMDTLKKVSKGKTTICIAHRLTTIQDADKIYLLENGSVVESGTHEFLVELGQKYFNLQKNQLITTESEESPEPGKIISHEEITAQEIPNPKKEEIEVKEFQEEKPPKPLPFIRVFIRLFSKYGRRNKCSILMAVLSSFALGVLSPLSAALLGLYTYNLIQPNENDYYEKSLLYFIIFLIFGLGVFVFTTIQKTYFALSGEKVAMLLRQDIFRKFLRMEMKWHDNPQNSFSVLSNRLERDSENLCNLISTNLGLVLQTISSVVIGLAITFYFSWKVSLVGLGFIPITMIVSRTSGLIMMKRALENKKVEDALKIIIEAVPNLKTIASLTAEQSLLKKFSQKLEVANKFGKKYALYTGSITGLDTFISFMFMGAVQAMCGYATEYDELSILNVYICFYTIYLTTSDITSTISMIPDLADSKMAAAYLYKYLDQESEIDIDSKPAIQSGTKADGLKIVRKIEFRNVDFKYPSRKKQVLNKMSFIIEAGQRVAFFGASGSGKSTIMQLLTRFYDVDQGTILINDKNIKEYDVRELRGLFGVVSQEPVLFNGTIEENIKYCNLEATEEDVKNAARQANALEFIEKNDFECTSGNDGEDTKLGSGFKRLVGPKGSQLSGGQKQRIAIARVLLKKPKIYLFDEATSALDSNSESIVQSALNEISKNCTTITVAHRISAIKDCEKIFVLKDGEIIESGNFDDLVNSKKHFYTLINGIST